MFSKITTFLFGSIVLSSLSVVGNAQVPGVFTECDLAASYGPEDSTWYWNNYCDIEVVLYPAAPEIKLINNTNLTTGTVFLDYQGGTDWDEGPYSDVASGSLIIPVHRYAHDPSLAKTPNLCVCTSWTWAEKQENTYQNFNKPIGYFPMLAVGRYYFFTEDANEPYWPDLGMYGSWSLYSPATTYSGNENISPVSNPAYPWQPS